MLRLLESQDDLQTARDQLVLHGLPGTAVLEDALAQAKAIQRSTEDTAIAEFNASHQTIKEGIRRAAEIDRALTPAALSDDGGRFPHAAHPMADTRRGT